MATVHELLSTMQANVSAATVGLPDLIVQVGIDFPGVKNLMENVRGGSALVSVMDRKLSRNTTRWKPTVLNQTVIAVGLTTAVTGGTITLGGTVGAGDAVSAVVNNGSVLGLPASFDAGQNPILTPMWAAVVSAVSTDTPTTVAAKLAAAINADPILSTWVRAVAVGPQVTLYSIVTALTTESGLLIETDPNGLILTPDGAVSPLTVASFAGNGGSQITEIGRRDRQLQVTVWTASIEDRDTVSNAIETMLAEMEVYAGSFPAGLSFPDGTSGRVHMMADFDLDDATQSDTYRRDFLVSVDYPLTTTDALYAVLTPAIMQFQVGYPPIT